MTSEVRAGSSEVRATATDRLRALLDERGVEWRERVYCKHSVTTFWHASGVRWHYRENRFGELRLHADDLTPEQAVEATLGRGECHVVREQVPMPDGGAREKWSCSECGGLLLMSTYSFATFDADMEGLAAALGATRPTTAQTAALA